jgi:hypothetical protein
LVQDDPHYRKSYVGFDKVKLNMILNDSLKNNYISSTGTKNRNYGSRGIDSHKFDIDDGDNVKIMYTGENSEL